MKKIKKIAYVTGTRADFGLMIPVLEAIDASEKLTLSVYATGMHLMKEHGNTLKDVRKVFPNTEVANVISGSDKQHGMSRFVGELIALLTEIFGKERPDMILVLGDRGEMLAAAVTSVYLGIPVAHIHGGEVTTTVDDAVRNAITKLATVHFAATDKASSRIAHMFEDPQHIHMVGAPGLDVIINTELPSPEDVYQHLQMELGKKFLLVTLHPVSEEVDAAADQMQVVLDAVNAFDLPVVVILPNNDAGGGEMINVINKQKDNPRYRIFPDVPHSLFLAIQRGAAVWIGNSSAVVIESGSWPTAVVNVGKRQQGRERGKNVIDCDYNLQEIQSSIERALNDKLFAKEMHSGVNPWGDGKASMRITKVLEDINLEV